MSKRGRPKQEQELALLAQDNLPESLQPRINPVQYQVTLDLVKRDRLEKGLKQLHEIAFNERLPDSTARKLAIKLGGNI